MKNTKSKVYQKTITTSKVVNCIICDGCHEEIIIDYLIYNVCGMYTVKNKCYCPNC